jgi:hypothetical protein
VIDSCICHFAADLTVVLTGIRSEYVQNCRTILLGKNDLGYCIRKERPFHHVIFAGAVVALHGVVLEHGA